MSTEMLLAKEKLIKAIRTCLKNNNQPPKENSIAVLLAEKSILTIMQTLEEKQNDTESMQELLLQLSKDLPTLDSITPDLPITGSLAMEDEHLDTISEMDLDEEIESSVENLNLTPSESEDLSDYVSECDLPFVIILLILTIILRFSLLLSLILMSNGDSTSFWYDNWSGVGAAKDLYPRLFALENFKEINVSSKINDSCLNRSFRRPARGGAEQAQLDALATLVSQVNLVNKADRWVWTLEGSGEFSVASTRKVIDENRLKSDLSKTIWVKYVPIKINVLAWKIKMDVLPTRLNISRRGIDIHSISCPICDNGIEASDHLFFRCQIATQLTRKIVNWWNIDQVDVNTYVEWCTWLSSLRMASKSKAMLEGIRYQQKDKNKAKTRQNRARDWKEHGKPKPKASAS
ncbi:RNA-directed DNA polymerase, eukaryota [Tanacetum coccineum]